MRMQRTGKARAGKPESGTSAITPLLLAGVRRNLETTAEVRSPFDGHLIASVCQATPDDALEAIQAAQVAFAETRELPAWRRSAILNHIADRLAGEALDLARGMALEAGKPLHNGRAEVARAIDTFRIAAEETKRIGGEILPLDWTAGNDGRNGLIRRFPIGPVLGITPFNFPLNLVAHKVAPAIAAGNPIIIKPAPQTPLTALRLGQMVVDAGWPAGAISVLPCSNEVAAGMIADDRIRMLSFTGSAKVGWALKAAAPRKRVTLELGGNAAMIVHEDADLELAAQAILQGGFSYAGQSCISVQRVFVHKMRWQTLAQRLTEGVEQMVVGDPLDEEVQIGPMISVAAAERAEAWIERAVDAGARLLTGGERKGARLRPAILAKVARTTELFQEEVFAPVVFLNPCESFDEAIEAVNDSRYGLQAAVFTRDWQRIMQAWKQIDAGAVLVNESTAWRADHMPYGGVKESGMGREGVRAAIDSMMEEKLLVARF
ncbi:MAG: aldehyde dehydrogenase family protein [Acidobacteriaceae bacterium]